MVALRQRMDLGFNAEQLADEIVQMRCQCQQQFGFSFRSQGTLVDPCGAHTLVQRGVRLLQFLQEHPVQANQAAAFVKIFERQTKACQGWWQIAQGILRCRTKRGL